MAGLDEARASGDRKCQQRCVGILLRLRAGRLDWAALWRAAEGHSEKPTRLREQRARAKLARRQGWPGGVPVAMLSTGDLTRVGNGEPFKA